MDILDVIVPWNDVEHVGSETPTTWNVNGHNENSPNPDIGHDFGIDLAVNGYSLYQ